MSKINFEKYTKEDGTISIFRCYSCFVLPKSYNKYLKAINPETGVAFIETDSEFNKKIKLEIPLNEFYGEPDRIVSKHIPSSLQTKILKGMKYEAELLHIYKKEN